MALLFVYVITKTQVKRQHYYACLGEKKGQINLNYTVAGIINVIVITYIIIVRVI